jgi:hypothetical protein
MYKSCMRRLGIIGDLNDGDYEDDRWLLFVKVKIETHNQN